MPRTREERVGTNRDDTIDERAAAQDLAVETGDGRDDVTTGSGDDVVDGGPGDDTIDMSEEGKDRVEMRVTSDGKATDGGDDVSGFDVGDDVVQFGGVYGDDYAGGPPTTTAEWLAYLDGDDGVALSDDDLLIVSPIIGFVGGVPVVLGLNFQWREGAPFNAGAELSSGNTEILFSEAMSAGDFITAIGGMDNYDPSIMAIVDLKTGLQGLLGLDGIRFETEVVVKTSLTHADIVQALADEEDLWNWDVSAVQWGIDLFNDDLSYDDAEMDPDSLFRQFNLDISEWDTGNMQSFSRMFRNAKSFNQDIGCWDTSKGITFTHTFFNADSFNQDISGWRFDVAQSVLGMFLNNDGFNQDISAWNVGNIRYMQYMFDRATSFNQDLGDWDVSRVENAEHMFDDTAMSIENLDATLVGWSKVDSDEAGLQRGVRVGTDNLQYSNETAVHHLETEYGWVFSDGMTLSDTVWVGTDAIDDYTADAAETNVVRYHALGGDDIIRGSSKNEHFYGGAGNDIIVTGNGSDTLHYLYTTDGNDRVAGFSSVNDAIDISVLLDGFVEGVSDVNNFVTAVIDPADANDILVSIDANGDGSGADVTIVLRNIANTFEATFVDDLVAADALILV